MRRRSCAIALAATAVALAFPAAASAAYPPEQLFTGKVKKNQGFKLSLRAIQGGNFGSGCCPTTLTALLKKHSGTGVGSVFQDNGYSFDSGLKFRGSKKLGSAQVSGTFPDNRGSIKMDFTATQAATRVPVPKNCTGTPGEKRKGTLTGSFELKADKLGTVKLRSARATLERPPNVKHCRPSHPREVHFLYAISSGTSGVYVFGVKPRGTAPVTEGIEAFATAGAFSIFHSYTVHAPRTHYSFSSDLSGATLKGYAGITGTATYTGTSGVGSSVGMLNGNLSVHMAAIGTVNPFASGPLTAHQTTN